MKKNTYSEKLRDPRWQKKRLAILERDEWRCQICFREDQTLHVHHRRYFAGKEPWDIQDESLITLCEECHSWETEALPEVVHDLTAVIKDKFFAEDIRQITGALINTPLYGSSDVSASVIAHWLGDADRFRLLWDKYFEYLEEKSENPF